MALGPGAKLGPYEVLAPLGAGGMGEVYRALPAPASELVGRIWRETLGIS